MIDKINLTPVPQPDRMWNYWKKEWKTLLVITVSGVLFNGSMSLIPTLQGKLLDSVIDSADLSVVLHRAAWFLAAVLLIQAMRAVKRYSVRVFANKTSATMRRMIYNNIMHRSFADLAGEDTGDLMNKAVGDVELCVEGMRKVTTEVFDTGVLMTGYVISMLLYDWKITLLSCVFIPAAMFLAERLKTVIARFNRLARTQSSAVAQLTYSDVDHILLYRVDSVMDRQTAEYREALNDLESKSVKAAVLENSMQPVYNAISMLGIAVVFFLGGRLVIAGEWTVGTFTAYVAIFTALGLKASKAAKLFNAFQKAVVSWKRIKPYYTGYCTTDETDLPDTGEKGLVCRDLSFRYPGMEKNVVEHISFTVRAGEILGVTGPVACGKSSLGTALTGVYPHSGEVRVNGLDLTDLTPWQRSRRISVLSHQYQLLSDTIYRNVTLGDDGDISGVLRDVCFDEDLRTMPDGVQTMVGNGGVRLSGGQQARIALARALWHRASLVILDDPFSAVDMATEKTIMQNLRTHYPDRAVVLISHRLAVFPGADRVLYLDGTAETGTHEELLARCEGYRNLFALQGGETA